MAFATLLLMRKKRKRAAQASGWAASKSGATAVGTGAPLPPDALGHEIPLEHSIGFEGEPREDPAAIPIEPQRRRS